MLDLNLIRENPELVRTSLRNRQMDASPVDEILRRQVVLLGARQRIAAIKLAVPGRVEVISGVNLPMLVRAFTYRTRSMDTLVTKAVSGGCEGVMHVPAASRHAATRS